MTHTISETLLFDAGFELRGNWELQGGSVTYNKALSAAPSVYAIIVNGTVMYVGAASIGLKKRITGYCRPGATQRTNIRINGLIGKALKAGETVRLVAACPEAGQWNGLPVDFVAGLEAGIVAEFKPPWNMQGVT